MRLLFATAALALLATCGYVGPPLPPALNLPRAVTDLRAEQVGDRIVVRFTAPVQTTEDLPVTRLRAIQLRVEADGASQPYEIPVTQTEHEIPVSTFAGKVVALSLRTTGTTGGESDVSNPVTLAVISPLEQPRVTPRNAPEGVALAWTGNAQLYRIQRSIPADPDPEFEQIAETAERSFTDVNTADGVRYFYVVTGFSGASARTRPSEQAAFTPQDTFAPAIPAGLTAVALGPAVDLSWTLNKEGDLAGYNLFRAVEDGPLAVYAEGVALPTFSDRNVVTGRRYRYAVSAVDKKGNQSARSEEKVVRVE